MNDNKEALDDEVRRKITELLNCGNERVELAAAKELVSLFGNSSNDDGIKLEVTIKIV